MKTISIFSLIAVTFSFQLVQAVDFSKCEKVIEQISGQKQMAFHFGKISTRLPNQMNPPGNDSEKTVNNFDTASNPRTFSYGPDFHIAIKSTEKVDSEVSVSCKSTSSQICTGIQGLVFQMNVVNDQCQVESAISENASEKKRTLFKKDICLALKAYGDQKVEEFPKDFAKTYKIEMGVTKHHDKKQFERVRLRNIRDNCKLYFEPYAVEPPATSSPKGTGPAQPGVAK